jgi:hypothetical protein
MALMLHNGAGNVVENETAEDEEEVEDPLE